MSDPSYPAPKTGSRTRGRIVYVAVSGRGVALHDRYRKIFRRRIPALHTPSVAIARRETGVFRRPSAPPSPLRGEGGGSCMGMNRIELVFLERPVAQSEFDRHIVKPARREAAIEMPQSRNDHPDDRRLHVGTGLIEDEEIEARSFRDGHAGRRLLARIEMAKLRAELRLDHRISAWRQIGMVLKAQR